MMEIATQIVNGGFEQCDQPPNAQRLVFRDRGGLGIEWIVSWEGNSLKHSIASKFFQDNWSCLISENGGQILLRKSLIDLQERIVLAMRSLALTLSDRRTDV